MMRMPYFADPENLKVPEEPERLALPENITALPLLQMAYRGQVQLTPQQMRAAIEALPFEVPKLSASAITTMDEKSFAAALERCIERSKQPVPRLNGAVEPLPLEELKRPMSRYRRF
jgi:hypothetical protein